MFVVDDLAAWLIGVLADSARKKLTDFIFGDEQERALRPAARAAIEETFDELSPDGDEGARQLAAAMRKALKNPRPAGSLTRSATLLDALGASVAGQLAVLDAGLAGTGRSSADVLGVSGAVLADRLTDRLVQQIVIRGSREGPLTPLANQLNHDQTHLGLRQVELQGQRVESTLTQLAEQLVPAGRPGLDRARPAGRPLDTVTDPFALEVHRPLQPEDPQPGLSALPAYVPRQHDSELDVVVGAPAGRARWYG